MNRLIHGDNLVALRRLRLDGQVRCVWIDPPYNTGNPQGQGRFTYDDARHDWLGFMEPRLALLRDALTPDGSLFIQLDDNQLDGTKLLLDRLFGPGGFISRITVAARSPSAFSTVNKGLFKASEYLLWYARDRARFRSNPVRVPRSPDRAYGLWLNNPDDPHDRWTFSTVRQVVPQGRDRDRWVVEHARQVCRLASISDTKAGKATVLAKAQSRAAPDTVLRVDRPGRDPQFVLRGQQLLFYDRQVTRVDGQLCASRPLTNVWTDLRWEGIAREGGVRLKGGKKPERLVRRCLQLATDPGDWVVDAFVGSGTTAAVAHKMGRRWIGVESGPAIELARDRLDRVCAGQDPTGVTGVEGYEGGGAYVVEQAGACGPLAVEPGESA